jgi:hypothetical protein
MTQKESLEKNYAFVESKIDEFLNIYRNKYILVYDEKVVGSFDTYETAATEGINNYGPDSGFLVHYVTETAVLNFIMSA